MTSPRTPHSPGPWRVRRSLADSTYTHIYSDSDNSIACTKTEANARLVAIAPELLAFAEHCVARLQHGPDANPNDGLLHDGVALLAKVKA